MDDTFDTDFSYPPEELKKPWRKTAKQAAKKAYQTNFVKTGQSLNTPLTKVNRAVIDQTTKDAITANTTIKQHNAKLRKLDILYSRYIFTTFLKFKSSSARLIRLSRVESTFLWIDTYYILSISLI
jgi:hypothetical protein